MATLTNPGNGATHHHLSPNAKKFYWNNTNPVVPSGTNWRLKIGSGLFGYDYYAGKAVPFTQLEDDNVGLMLPDNTRCFATVEWSTDSGTTWSNGSTYTYFFCKP